MKRQGAGAPASLKDLAGLRLEVVAGSSHADRLRLHRRRLPGLDWVEMAAPGSEELLERLDIGLADCTVVDSDSLDVARNFHPGLRPAFVLESAQPQAWVLGRGMDLKFSRQVVAFFKAMEKSGDLIRLRERYFGHVTRLQEADVLGVLEKRGTLLRDLRQHFQDAEGETGLDWRLLAAIAYQESQWDAHAVSPTGVRGIMMLTEDTADHLGVKNRLDARESILGGARYVVQLKSALPETVPEPDRTWLALGARYTPDPKWWIDVGAAYIWVRSGAIDEIGSSNFGQPPSAAQSGLVRGSYDNSVVVLSAQFTYAF